VVRPLHREDGRFEVMAWGSWRRFGWLSAAALEPLPGGVSGGAQPPRRAGDPRNFVPPCVAFSGAPNYY
jgi:hypothetical protein